MALRKPLILRRPQSGRLEGPTPRITKPLSGGAGEELCGGRSDRRNPVAPDCGAARASPGGWKVLRNCITRCRVQRGREMPGDRSAAAGRPKFAPIRSYLRSSPEPMRDAYTSPVEAMNVRSLFATPRPTQHAVGKVSIRNSFEEITFKLFKD